ncbi:MAG: glutamine-hydrolyzing carbamoyl-phosphate synthase small subunit [Thermoplasmata archaeon]|nr:glutamine-hydrolyzing carbamoyl-phosphate synthase small subunit [Thermoplasmata archaeon]
MGSSTPVTAHPEPKELSGTLFLEDGTRFDGFGFGAEVERVGEVVFTTGMVGYPESLTDPSYRGQILTFTYPLLGNYGVPSTEARDGFGLPTNLESPSVQVRAMIVRGLTRPNHWAQGSRLEDWLRTEGVPGVGGIDTRRLTEHLRSHGVLRGVVRVGPHTRSVSSGELARVLKRAPRYEEEPLVAEVSVRTPKLLGANGGPLVALLDGGVKASIVRALLSRDLSVLRLPYDHEVPAKWEGRKVRGLLVGNGPGDPAQLAPTIAELGRPANRGLTTLGICLGQQLLGLSRGATTYKLKFGHRGQNKTVLFPKGRALIVSENHGYAVASASLARTGLKVWATSPDDGTVEGLRDARGRVLALQGHPEGHPGPQEAGFVFDQFAERVRRKSG